MVNSVGNSATFNQLKMDKNKMQYIKEQTINRSVNIELF